MINYTLIGQKARVKENKLIDFWLIKAETVFCIIRVINPNILPHSPVKTKINF